MHKAQHGRCSSTCTHNIPLVACYKLQQSQGQITGTSGTRDIVTKSGTVLDIGTVGAYVEISIGKPSFFPLISLYKTGEQH